MKKRLLLLPLLVLALPLGAQSAREEIAADPARAAGLHYAYPGPQSVQTPAPRGYKPFYISHFGRHGSRWHLNDQDYSGPAAVLQAACDAGVLTPVGEEVLRKSRAMADDAKGRLGELTPLGARQHQGVARRMLASFPEAFRGDATVTAASTTSGRVMMSMFWFCSELCRFNPRIELSLSNSKRESPVVSNRVKRPEDAKAPYNVREEKARMKQLAVQPERLLSVLFSDPAWFEGQGQDPKTFVWDLYYLAEMAQNNELDSLSFLDVFTPEELYDCWRADNYDMYLHAADPRGMDVTVPSCKPMIAHILDSADEVIETGGHGATLRFSHDSYLVPMAVCLRLDGCTGVPPTPERCDEAFIDYKISPMAGNIQLVFYRNRKGEVLVKFLLNEDEVGIPAVTNRYPYYRWEDVKAYYKDYYNL